MAEPFAVTGGAWWRFERYQLRDGVIRPASGAKLERYDPWAEYQAQRNKMGMRTSGRRPYESLLDLTDTLLHGCRPCPRSRKVPYTLTADAETALLSWCATHGLLGILPQQVLMVDLAFRREHPPHGARAVHWWPSRRYVRTTTGWSQLSMINLADEGIPETVNRGHRERVFWEDRRRDWRSRAVVLHQLGHPQCRAEPLTQTWARFFPDIPQHKVERYVYPMPRTKEFWRLYGEPLDAFLEGAFLFQSALHDLAHHKSPNEPRTKDLRHVDVEPGPLQALVAPVSQALQPLPDGRFRLWWIAPALLSSFAMMALQDLAERHRPLECDVCHRLFVTKAWQGRYCSARCRQTAQKRAHRKRKREINAIRTLRGRREKPAESQ